MKINKVIENSFVDYPSKTSLVIFTSGCNYKCPSCHAKEIISDHSPGINIKTVNYINSRKGWIDGVVLCGGEPTLQLDIVNFAKELKQHNIPLKLDTNGSNPSVLQELVKENLVDYLAMDIKGPKNLYPLLIGKEFIDFRDNVEKGMALATQFPHYEFRTTISPVIRKNSIEFLNPKEVEELAEWIINITDSNNHKYYLQKFYSRTKNEMVDERLSKENLETRLHETPDSLINQIYKSVIKYLPNCEIR